MTTDDAPGSTPAEATSRRATSRRWLVVVAVVVLVGLGVSLGIGLSTSGSAAPVGPEGVPIQQVPDLASNASTANGAPVGVITCRSTADQIVHYHIHVLVNIYVNGHQVRIPAGAGIAAPRLVEHLPSGIFYNNAFNGCLYWLHVHANDGIVHVESPYKHTFTLGQFFDVWRQPLGPAQVGPARGPVVAFVNGRRFTGNPRNLPLLDQGVIQLDVGTPVVAFKSVHFHVSGECGAGSLTCHGKSG